MEDLLLYVNRLIRSIDDNDEYIRASSIRSLGELKTRIPFDLRRRVVKEIVTSGKDKKNIVKHASAITIGQLKDVIFSEGMMNVATE